MMFWSIKPQNLTGQFLKCTPMALQSVWSDPLTTRECISVEILLSPGVLPKDVLSVRVFDGGLGFEISIVWVKQFYDMSHLHKKWLSFEWIYPYSLRKYRPKFLGVRIF